MNMKKGLMCLSIVAILTLCTMNGAVASAAKCSTGVHSNRVTDVRGQLQTNLFIALTDPNSSTAVNVNNCTVKVGASVFILGRLIGGDVIIPYYITDAKVNIQSSRDGQTWATIGTATTSGKDEKEPGFFMGSIKQPYAGVGYYRATYDGANETNKHLTPSVSNVVTLTTY